MAEVTGAFFLVDMAVLVGGYPAHLTVFTAKFFWLNIKVYMLFHPVISGNCLFAFLVVFSVRFVCLC